MMHGVRIEVLLAATYALFLLTVAAILERLARHTHRRTNQYYTLGFHYEVELDRWECPTGQYLHRHQTDPARRVVRYRAPSSACNVCAVKSACTDSNAGREIEHPLDGWLETELGRFHRGLSLALLVLAALILGIEIARFRQEREIALLACLLVPVLMLAARWSVALFSPATPDSTLATPEVAHVGFWKRPGTIVAYPLLRERHSEAATGYGKGHGMQIVLRVMKKLRARGLKLFDPTPRH